MTLTRKDLEILTKWAEFCADYGVDGFNDAEEALYEKLQAAKNSFALADPEEKPKDYDL